MTLLVIEIVIEIFIEHTKPRLGLVVLVVQQLFFSAHLVSFRSCFLFLQLFLQDQHCLLELFVQTLGTIIILIRIRIGCIAIALCLATRCRNIMANF